jgi:TolA-binding protein
MTSRAALWLLTIALACAAVHAEAQEPEPGQATQVKSGDDSVELLSQRLTERTAEIDKLKQEGEKQRQESEKLRQEVTRLQTELTVARQAAAQAPPVTSATHAQVAPPGPPVATPTTTSPATMAATTAATSPPEPIRETVFLRQPDRFGQTPWGFLAGSCAAMLLVGFVLGWTTLDRRIRQKYGGLKIY